MKQRSPVSHYKLEDGKYGWGKYRLERGIRSRLLLQVINFSYRSYIKYDFRNCDFEGCIFKKTDFAGSNFNGATFKDCIFEDSNFSGGRFSGSKIIRQKIIGCSFSGIIAPNIEFIDCELWNVSLFQANIAEANFGGSTIKNTDVRNCKANNVKGLGSVFINCQFQKSIMPGSKISFAHFKECSLSQANLSKSVIDNTIWEHCSFRETKASNIDAQYAKFIHCDFRNGIFDGFLGKKTKFNDCSLAMSNFIASDLAESAFANSRFDYALFCKCEFKNALIKDSIVFGMSCWDSDFSECKQQNLKINISGEYSITVSSIEFAYFLYQSMKNKNLKTFFESTSEKMVLVLGRFGEEHKTVIELLRGILSKNGFIPVVFDFEKPKTHDLSAVVLSLALLSRFIIIDLSNPKCTPHEVATIAPNVNSPIASIIQVNQKPYAMFSDMQKRYRWVLEPCKFNKYEEIAVIINSSIIPKCENYIKERDR